MFWLVRHVVLAEVGSLAIAADIGAVETVVARVAWPHPVVGVAAEFAYARWRRVYQAHVADFQLLDQVELQAAVVGRHGAAEAGFFFAFGDQFFLVFFDRIDACLALQLGHVGGDDLVADIGHGRGDEDAAAWGGRQFFSEGLGQETVGQQIALLGGIDRHAVVDAMVIGGNQALRRDERGRATAQADDGAHRELGQFGQGGRIEFQSGRFQFLGYLWQLLGHPHAFVGVCKIAQDGERD